MKYIDAEKFKSEIERHRQAIRVLNEHTAPEQTSKTCAIFQYSDTILSELLSFIDSLQQEQPEKGLDVTEFCEPINQGIAKCIADHWWEMLDGKDAEEKQPEEG